MGYWLGIVFSCLDVLCVAVFCDAFLERKTRGLRFVVGALLCGVLSYIATVFVSHISEESPITLLKFAALITVYFVFASLFYLGKFWMRLLVVLLAYAIFTLLEFCVLYSLLALLHIHYDEYVSNMVLYFTGVTITYSLKFLLSSAIKSILCRHDFCNDVRFADFCGGAQQLLGNYDCLLCPDMGFVTCR